MSEPIPRFSLPGELIWYAGLALATVGPAFVLAASAVGGDSEDHATHSATFALAALCVAAFPLAIWMRRILIS